MWKNLRLRPVLASVLVLALACRAFAADDSTASADTSVYNYAGHVTFTVQGCAEGASIADFPVYIRVSEASIPGFSYDFLRNETNDLVFLDSAGLSLAYEMVAWNPEGESAFWVKVPKVHNGATVTMCWNLRDGCKKPPRADATEVWSDYVGVWHMDETISATAAPTTRSADATGHGLDGKPNCKEKDGVSQGNLSQMVSTAGVFGNGRVNATESKQWGNHLEVPAYDSFGVGSNFTVSCWVKFKDYANYPQLFCRKEKTTAAECKGWHVESNGSDRKKLTARGDGGSTPNADIAVFDAAPKGQGYFNVVVVFSNATAIAYNNGVLRGSGAINAASDNGLPLAIGCGHFGEWKDNNDFRCIDGAFDEVRLFKGLKSAAWIAADYAQGAPGFYAAGAVTNDTAAVLKNEWKREPSMTQTTWEYGTRPKWEDFDIDPKNGSLEDDVTVVIYDRATGAEVGRGTGWDFGSVIPSAPGSYRVEIAVAQNGSEATGIWGALDYTLGFRIATNGGSHEFNVNVARILLANDDYSVAGGEVEWQGYDDEDPALPSYWQHLDADGNDASTTYCDYWSDSYDFNLGGGTHHIYRHGDAIDRLWDLRDIRIGNTFNNGEILEERSGRVEVDDEGLAPDQNYLPWNRESQRVLGHVTGEPVGGYHRYASHIVMQNSLDAAVTSAYYTNGIGTIYFDAVNGFTGNVTNGVGEANYRLVVEIATDATYDASLPPSEVYVSSGNAQKGVAEADDAVEPFYKANWVRWNGLRVLRFDGGVCTDLGVTNAVDLMVTEGGTYDRFYRVIVPVNQTPKTGGIRFRIRREAIDRDQALYPDGSAYILLDNVICSTPTEQVNLAPYGKFFPEKTRKNNDIVQGWEGAFVPAYPSTADTDVRGRAKATMPNGAEVQPGLITAATMHYRWHYLEQQSMGWHEADLDPVTLMSHEPLELPPLQGDIDFWFEALQNGRYYVYADYSGTDLRLGKTGYTEEIPAVTNQAPTAVVRPDGKRRGDWFVRMREAKSDYGEMKLLVKASETGTVCEEPLSVVQNNLWRGYYQMTNAFANGIWWRIEARNKQKDGATEWNWSTNRWYVMDWTDTPPTFPATGRMSEGDANAWSRMPCDKQTGYLMFQVDETSLGVTVIHADYQTFDRWDAVKGYFTGSSADTNSTSMVGTSAMTREYSMSYHAWADTSATDADWQLNFNTNAIGDVGYPGYETFVGTNVYKKAWLLGKGMWVYGKYCEPKSHVALQMAGCGEGFAEFSDAEMLKERWPRGLESVSFHARIAQEISPEHAVFYAGEAAKRMTNYAFMVRTCFDQKENKGFCGNAAISLFSYYKEKTGAYEARWEQIGGKITDNVHYPNEVLAPEPAGQRLVISRWNWNGKYYDRQELVATTNYSNQGAAYYFDKWNAPMPTMNLSATNNLMPFLISTYQSDAATYVIAAVRIQVTGSGQTRKGAGVDPFNAVPNDNWYCVVLKDTDAKRLRFGNYGILSSNCEGLHVTPQFCRDAVWPVTVDEKTIVDRFGEDMKTWNKCAPMTLRNYTFGNFESCLDDLVYDEYGDNEWTMNEEFPGRNDVFYEYDESAKAYYYGFSYVRPYQTVDVYESPKGRNSWRLLGQVPIEGFGQPGPDPDHEPTFYFTDDSLLRLKTGGGYDDYRTDVVLNDVVIRQWRGWNSDTDEDSRKKKSEEYRYTNFVFTCGWITNGAVQLSAKRTPTDEPCSIRSPMLDGRNGNGFGLGSIRFTYREPQKNINLLVQIATNLINQSTDLEALTYSISEGTGNRSWFTVTNLTYDVLWPSAPEEGDTRTWTQTFNCYGAKGLMRIVVDPKLVREVSDPAWRDTSAFGAIEITDIKCFDEPGLDKGCWWGWNLQIIGDQYDSQKRMYLPDGTWDIDFGHSLALNNSVTADTNPAEETANFSKHMPFLQSPTFTNAVIGQISFKARKYELSDYAPDAQVVVYGSDTRSLSALDDTNWVFIAAFPVTNTVYTTYTCKTDTKNFYALRLAVVDVPGTPPRPADPPPGDAPQRVLIDEVSISEAVRAVLAFRNVGAFRSDLNKNTFVTGVTTRVEQPLCGENWGVQAEVFATMLGDEIDRSFTPRVKLHWYVGKEPWGYDNWKSRETGSAYLAQTEETNYVFRSSYVAAPAAVMVAQSEPGTVVQYMLELEYRRLASPLPGQEPQPTLATNWLDAAAWTTPDWYAPVDYNADPQYGAGEDFAAFTILDTVAPGWAWINEVNIYGVRKPGGANSDKKFQYVEVCVPAEADITGWRLRMLEAEIYGGKVVTNDIARFGRGNLGGRKTNNRGMCQNKVFRSVGNSTEQLHYEDGTLDGLWNFSLPGGQDALFRWEDGVWYVAAMDIPFGVQLVRPSGIIESSVVVIGEDEWGEYSEDRNPAKIAEKLNRLVPGSKFFYAAQDNQGTFRSGSVTEGHGDSPSVWTNDWACSPGYINTNWGGKVEQKIDPLHPTPHGDSIVIYASVDTKFGHIHQEIGEIGSKYTNSTEVIILARGSETGTNIYYTVDPWYELKSVMTNDKPEWAYVKSTHQYTAMNIGKGASNNVTVVATADIDSVLRDYGLTDDNPYTPAAMAWLFGGKTLRDEFANPGQIALADYVNIKGEFVSKMELTTMYWLDMDPTIGGMALQSYTEPLSIENGNVKTRVYMRISHTNELGEVQDEWSPYVLRGLDPNYHSQNYTNSHECAAWTSETFKVVGFLDNGYTKQSNLNDWIPLRWFVFHKDSFYQPADETPEHLPYTTEIELVDPKTKASAAYDAYWYDWFQDPAHASDPIYYKWSIDSRSKPTSPEVLQKQNYFNK